jgi:hypothetical protein
MLNIIEFSGVILRALYYTHYEFNAGDFCNLPVCVAGKHEQRACDFTFSVGQLSQPIRDL